MLCISYFIFIWKFCILIKIIESHEFQSDEKKSNLKEQTNDSNDELFTSWNELDGDDENILKILHYLDKTPNNSEEITPNFPGESSFSQNINYDLQDFTPDLLDLNPQLSNVNYESQDFILDVQDINDHLQDIDYDFQSITEFLPDLNSHLPDLNAHVPDLNAHLPDLNAHLPDLNAHLPDLNAHLPDLNSDSQDFTLDFKDLYQYLQDINYDSQDFIMDFKDLNPHLPYLNSDSDSISDAYGIISDYGTGTGSGSGSSSTFDSDSSSGSGSSSSSASDFASGSSSSSASDFASGSSYSSSDDSHSNPYFNSDFNDMNLDSHDSNLSYYDLNCNSEGANYKSDPILCSECTGFDIESINYNSYSENINLGSSDLSTISSNVINDTPPNTSCEQDVHLDIPNTSFGSQETTFSVEREPSISTTETLDLKNVHDDLQNITSSLQNNTYDLKSVTSFFNTGTPNLKEFNSKLENIMYSMRNNSHNLEKSISKLEYIVLQLKKICSDLEYNTTSLQSNTTDLSDGNTFDLEKTLFVLQNVNHHLEDESSSIKDSFNSSITEAMVDNSNEEISKISLKRKREGTKNIHENEKMIIHKKVKGSKDDMSTKKCTKYSKADIVRTNDIEIFSLVASKYVFNMEQSEISQELIPSLQKIFFLLKEKLNLVIRKYNSNIQELHSIIKEELKNVSEEDMMKIIIFYNYIKDHNYQKLNESFSLLPFKNKLNGSFIKFNDISSSLNACTRKFKNLEEDIKLYGKAVKMISSIINKATYNYTVFFASIFTPESNKSLYFKILRSISEMIEHIEKSLTNRSYILDQNIINMPKKHLESLLRHLSKTSTELENSSGLLKRLNISSKDDKKMIAVVFHFFQETNKKSKKMLEEFEKNSFIQDLIGATSEILLKEENYISESLKKSLASFNLGVEELNINETCLNYLSVSKFSLDLAERLHLSIMGLVRYSSIRLQYHDLSNIYENVKKLISKGNMECLNRRKESSESLRDLILLKLKPFKEKISNIELEITNKSLYNIIKNDIFRLNDSFHILRHKSEKLLQFLNSINESFPAQLLINENNEEENGSMVGHLLYMLYYMEKDVDDFYIDPLK